MTSIRIGRFGKGRLWLDEPINFDFLRSQVLERHVASGVGSHQPRAVAVEVYIPRGPRAEYGVLGMRYSPNGDGDLLVRVCVGEQSGRDYSESLAAEMDDVHIGLPGEYAGAVLQKTCEAACGHLGSGTLVVDQAVYGIVGSSASLFEQLATLVVRLVLDPQCAEEQMIKTWSM